MTRGRNVTFKLTIAFAFTSFCIDTVNFNKIPLNLWNTNGHINRAQNFKDYFKVQYLKVYQLTGDKRQHLVENVETGHLKRLAKSTCILYLSDRAYIRRTLHAFTILTTTYLLLGSNIL